MSSKIAIPVLTGSLRIHIEKGRQWSVVEHMLLWALCKKPYRASGLAEYSQLPRQVVIEAVIRLMRAGWVELVSTEGAVGFRATKRGETVVGNEELPAITQTDSKWTGFSIDRIAGSVYRNRDLDLLSWTKLSELRKHTHIVDLPDSPDLPMPSGDEIIDTILNDDERFRGVAEDLGMARKYALVLVKGGSRIENLPLNRSIPAQLKKAILAAASTGAGPKKKRSVPKTPVSKRPDDLSSPQEVTFEQRDIILGGKEHEALLVKVLKNARHRVIIHSTFIYADRFKEFVPLIGDAARRGVKVDILWGQMERNDADNSSAREIRDCQKLIDGMSAPSELIRIHPVSTGSHAKLIVADRGSEKDFVGVVGSCNWFASAFKSYEASVRFRDPKMVCKIVSILGDLARGMNGHFTSLASEFHVLGQGIKKLPPLSGGKIRAALVTGASHGAYIRKARDEAREKIVVASHRISEAAETSVLIPARAAASDRTLDITIQYCTTSGKAGRGDVAEKVRDNRTKGVNIRRIFEPRLHAKYLVWDRDCAVVTSQNWLSSDPPSSSPLSEVGVYLEGTAIGRTLVEKAEFLFRES